jgi:pectin methylesterase-like acyl-CoA thioesterase
MCVGAVVGCLEVRGCGAGGRVLAVGAAGAKGTVITVCASGCGYTTIQAAVDSVPNGATIRIAASKTPYTGVTVPDTNTSLTRRPFEGAGAGKTALIAGNHGPRGRNRLRREVW